MNYTDLSPRLHSKFLKCQSTVVKHKRSEAETSSPLRGAAATPRPRQVASVSVQDCTDTGEKPRERGQRRPDPTPAPARPYLRTHLAARGTAEAWPKPAAGQLPPPRAPAAGSRGPGRSEARAGGDKAQRRRTGGARGGRLPASRSTSPGCPA